MISNKKSNKTNIEGVNSKHQSVNEDTKSVELVQVQKNIVSERYQSEYVPALSCIQTPILQQLHYVLNSNEFICYNKPETESILKICTKSTWESLIYRVKIGNMETQINVFRMTAMSKNYTPPLIAKGQFGKVSHLSYQRTDYVIKSIKLNSWLSSQLSNVLREVFMAKLASCLQVGPRFGDIYGYDAILFSDCLQYSMQMCQTTYDQKKISQELNTKSLMKCMKILHTLNICHNDIKLENIGWSRRLKKFVFLDFGFTKYISENLGFKTYTKFEGTYKYSSDELRKMYLLRNCSYVDLYYNDLHALQETWIELKELLLIYEAEKFNLNSSNESEEAQNDQIEDQQQIIEGEFAEVVPFFKLKFLFFKQDYNKVVEMLESEQVLIYTFKKILYDAINEINSDEFPENLLAIQEKYAQLCLEMEKSKSKIHKFDAFLCDYLLQMSCQESLSYNERLKEISQRENCQSFIRETWGKKIWMEELFYFLDDDTSFRQRVIPTKNMSILSDLLAFLRTNIKLSQNSPLKRLAILKSKPSPASMLHDVMIMFFDYFYQQENLVILELILPYFITFCDEYNCEQMQILILRLYEPNEKSYVAKNLQFLVGKRLTLLGYERRVEASDNLANVNQVVKRLKQENASLDISFLQYLQETVAIMNIINSLRLNDGCLLKIQQIRQQLNAYSIKYQDFQPDVSQMLLKMIPIIYEKSLSYMNLKILKNLDNSNLKTRYFKTKYIRLVQLNALYLTSNDESNILQKIFLQSYFPFSNFQGLYNMAKIEESQLQHYLQLRRFHNFGITQLEIGIIVELKQEKDRRLVEQFIYSYFDNFKLDRIKSIEDIICVFNSFSRLICIIISYRKPEFVKLHETLSKKAMEFIKWTEYYANQIKQENESQQALTKKGQFVYLQKLCYACCLLGLNQVTIAAGVFLDMFTNIHVSNNTAFSYLCRVYRQSNKTDQDKNLQVIATQISQINTFICLVTQEVKQLLCSPVAFRPLIVANCAKRGVFETYDILIKLLILLNPENSFFITLHSKPLIDYFLGLLRPNDIIYFLMNLLENYKINQIVQFPGISILLFQLYLKSGGVKSFMEKTIVKRVLICCAFGFQQIKSNSMIWVKKLLRNQILKFLNLNNKSRIIGQFLFMTKKDFKNFVDKQSRRVNKRKTPEIVKEKLEKTLVRVVNFQKSFFFQQVNEI